MSQGFINQILPSSLTQVPTTRRFLSGSGVYTTPSNVSYITVTAQGGGSGGCGSSGGYSNGAPHGGGSGAFCVSIIVNPSATYTYSVGSGGAGGSVTGSPSTAGSATTFSGGSISAGGGTPTTASSPGSGGTASGGNIYNLSGENGGPNGYNGSAWVGGAGGGFGGGVGGSSGSANGANGVANSGGGGSGSGPTSGTGGQGGSGFIAIQEFYQPVSPTSSTGTGSYVLANAPSIIGVTNGSFAAAGAIGEVLISSIPAVSAAGITTNTPANLTSIMLTPGAWALNGNVQFIGAGSTVVAYSVGVFNTTSATLPDQSLWGTSGTTSLSGSSSVGVTVPYLPVNISSNTTYYLVAQAGFTGGTCAIAGRMYATRIR